MLANFVEETVNAPGTSTSINLGGAATGRIGFVTAFGGGASCFYYMTDGTLFETGYGVVTSGSPNTFSRDTVLDNSSGTTARLNFTGATRIYGALPAERHLYLAPTKAGPIAITGPLIDSRVYVYDSVQNLGDQIPLDSTVPTSTEGAQIISTAWTPRSATSRIRLTFSGTGATSVVANWTAAIFAGGAAAIAADWCTTSANNAAGKVHLVHEYVPGVTTAITYSVRVGMDRAGNLTFNGYPGPNAYFTGVAKSASLLIEEFGA